MSTGVLDLWTITLGRPQIDPNDLAEAVIAQAGEDDLDYRTRMLIHDSVIALKSHWGPALWRRWMDSNPPRERIEEILGEEFDKVGFPLLGRRMIEKTEPVTVKQFLNQVSRILRSEARFYITGTASLILLGKLPHHTDTVDTLDELPRDLAENKNVLAELEHDFGMKLRRDQTFFHPLDCKDRGHFFGNFGRLSVYLVDAYDVFLSLLPSRTGRDMGTMRMLALKTDKQELIQRFQDTCGSFLADPQLLKNAQDNWHILFGEDLPHEHDTTAS